MHEAMDMTAQMEHYDLVVVHYFNAKLAGKKETERMKQVFSNTMVAFRETLRDQVDKGVTKLRRVRFAECDYSKEEHQKFLIDKDHILYPNIVMYVYGTSIPFNLYKEEFLTSEEDVNWLTAKILDYSNFFVPTLTCAEFEKKWSNNETITVYFGPESKVAPNQPMANLISLRYFDKKSFGEASALNIYVLDNEKNTDCFGKFGLPEQGNALLYYVNSAIQPRQIGE